MNPKNQILLFFMINLLLFLIPFSFAAIVADHNAVAEFDLYYDDDSFKAGVINAKNTLHIGYGHTSHGSQITSSRTAFNDFMNEKLSVEDQDLYYWISGGSDGALDLEEGNGYGEGWLDHDCGYSGWDDETRYYLDGSDPGAGTADHSDVNIIMWSWCGQASYTNIQSHYIDNMNALEFEYPGVTFIYMTGHLDGSGLTGSLHTNNNIIRNHVNSTDKILFDFEEIESYNPDGDYFGNLNVDDGCNYDGGNWANEWQDSHTSGTDWYSVSCAHSVSVNCNMKVKAFWWMMARLGGWSANPDSDSDGYNNDVDNCPTIANADQTDSDSDGTGDVCDSCPNDGNKIVSGICGCGIADLDSDSDSIMDCNDNCPNDSNSDQTDFDSDDIGDVCDLDDDNDSDPDSTDCNDNDNSIYNGATEICDGIDQDCDGNNDNDACSDCSEGIISSRCACGDESYNSGYCCSGSHRITQCDAPNCDDGEIRSTCACQGENRNSGYCCNNIYQNNDCGTNSITETFDNSDNLNVIEQGISISDQAFFSAGVSIDDDPNLVSIYLFDNISTSTSIGTDYKSNNNMFDVWDSDPTQSTNIPSGFSGYSIDLDGDDTACIDSGFTFRSDLDHTLCWWTYKRGGRNQFAQTCGYDTWGDTTYTWRINNCNAGTGEDLSANVAYPDPIDWMHICNTYDESDNYLRSIIINGDTDNKVSSSGNFIAMDTSARWCIGSYGGGGYFDGLLYQPMWFDRVLSDSEIQALYNNNYFGSGSGTGRLTSIILQSAYNISRINNITWVESGTDDDNQILMTVSVDGGQHWQRANNGNAIDIIYTGSELVYDVFFNSTDSVISIDDLTISWTENINGESVELCGNGILDSGEDCDGLNLNEQNCSSLALGFVSGILFCNQTCQFDTHECLTDYHNADSDNDGVVEIIELNDFVTEWKSTSSITLADIISAIRLWKQ